MSTEDMPQESTPGLSGVWRGRSILTVAMGDGSSQQLLSAGAKMQVTVEVLKHDKTIRVLAQRDQHIYLLGINIPISTTWLENSIFYYNYECLSDLKGSLVSSRNRQRPQVIPREGKHFATPPFSRLLII